VLTAEMMAKPAITPLAHPLAMGGSIQPTNGGYLRGQDDLSAIGLRSLLHVR
jgi:hypothetical protein